MSESKKGLEQIVGEALDQIEMLLRETQRFLTVADIGAGKTCMVGLLIEELDRFQSTRAREMPHGQVVLTSVTDGDEEE